MWNRTPPAEMSAVLVQGNREQWIEEWRALVHG